MVFSSKKKKLGFIFRLFCFCAMKQILTIKGFQIFLAWRVKKKKSILSVSLCVRLLRKGFLYFFLYIKLGSCRREIGDRVGSKLMDVRKAPPSRGYYGNCLDASLVTSFILCSPPLYLSSRIYTYLSLLRVTKIV